MAYLILVVLWVLFYVLHSLFASMNIKRKFKGWLGSAFKWYRLLYSVFATFFFLAIMIYAGQIPHLQLFASSGSTTYFGFLITGLGTIIVVKSFKYVGFSSFIGTSPEQEGSEVLVRDGIHRAIRHPMYLGTILIFLGYLIYQPYMSSLIHLLMLLLYLPVGIYLEEKKLATLFGKKYEQYREAVPMLIPWTKKKGT